MVTEHEVSDALCDLLSEVHFCHVCNALPCMECEQMLAALGLPPGTNLPKLVAAARAVADEFQRQRDPHHSSALLDDWFQLAEKAKRLAATMEPKNEH